MNAPKKITKAFLKFLNTQVERSLNELVTTAHLEGIRKGMQRSITLVKYYEGEKVCGDGCLTRTTVSNIRCDIRQAMKDMEAGQVSADE